MFSQNDKISERQCMRLLFFDVIGIATLLLPTFLAKVSKTDGILCILFGMILAAIYLFFLNCGIKKMKCNFFEMMEQVMGKIGMKIVSCLYGAYYLFFGGFAIYLLCSLIQENLLKDTKFYVLLLVIYVVVIFAIYRGIECRARVYEILYYIILIPFIIMLLLGLKDIRLQNLLPMGVTSVSNIFRGTYGVFLVYAILQMLLLSGRYIASGSGIRAGKRMIILSGVLLIALYEILLGVFGMDSISSLTFPAVDLMSTITFPGGFLRRQDAFMVAVWFFTVFAAGASGVFYGTSCISQLFHPKEENMQKIWHRIYMAGGVIAAVLISYFCFIKNDYLNDTVYRIFWYLTPCFLLFPFLMFLVGKRKKLCALACVLLSAILFSGCSVTELENKSFPLAILAGEENGRCNLLYKYQDFSQISSDEQEGTKPEEQQVTANSFYEAMQLYEEENGKIIDLNHAKVLVLEESLLENEEMYYGMIHTVEQTNEISRNVLVFTIDDIVALGKLQEEMPEALGTYLEELLEENENYNQNRLVTLGDLINDEKNLRRNIVIPYLKIENNLPMEDGGYLVSQGRAQGKLTKEAAAWGNIFQKTRVKWDFTMQDENHVHLEDIHIGYRYDEQLNATVTLKAKCILYGSKAVSKKQIEEYLKFEFAREILKFRDERQLDLTNSYDYLPLTDTKLAREYYDQFTAFQQEVHPHLKLDLRMVHTKPSDE